MWNDLGNVRMEMCRFRHTPVVTGFQPTKAEGKWASHKQTGWKTMHQPDPKPSQTACETIEMPRSVAGDACCGTPKIRLTLVSLKSLFLKDLQSNIKSIPSIFQIYHVMHVRTCPILYPHTLQIIVNTFGIRHGKQRHSTHNGTMQAAILGVLTGSSGFCSRWYSWRVKIGALDAWCFGKSRGQNVPEPNLDVCCIGWYGHHVLGRLFSGIRLNKVWRRVWIWCHAESTAKDANGPCLASKIKDWYHLYHISSSDLPRYPI